MFARTSASVGEAQASVNELTTIIGHLLESNQELSRRMTRLEQQSIGRSPSTIVTIAGRDAFLSPSVPEANPTEDAESIVTIKGPVPDSQNAENSELRRTFGFTFDQDLNTPRPYTRAMKRQTGCSTASSEIHTMGWSCLSGVSLAEVSQTSVINLLLCPQDLWNGSHYIASRTDHTGFVLSKSYSDSSNSLLVQSAPTLRSRLGNRASVRVGKKGRDLGTIKEDMGVPVPAMKIYLIGMFST